MSGKVEWGLEEDQVWAVYGEVYGRLEWFGDGKNGEERDHIVAVAKSKGAENLVVRVEDRL